MNLIVDRTRKLTLAGLLLACYQAPAAAGVIEHSITLEVKPGAGEVVVNDRLTLPAGVAELVLSPAARRLDWGTAGVEADIDANGRRRLTMTSTRSRELTLRYRLPLGDTAGGGRSGAAGFVWDGRGPWYGDAPGRLHRFRIEAASPADWRVISQGARERDALESGGRVTVWHEPGPQERIYLIAAPFTAYSRESGGLEAMAFLRKPDQALAGRYMDLAFRYIRMYEQMIGEYPYAKFALVENTWDSGFGMPSFTLLGPRVIRLPFIPYTSYPHEILHNWWGNSVYVDHASGNWSEGLTAYLADHWLRARRGEGAAYRRDILQEYLSFVDEGNDFPLSAFRARHGESSQAVGYGKSMMVFHMLRRRLGDEAFFEALGRFYERRRFEVAGFADLRTAFEAVGGQALEEFFEQWIQRSGAPALVLAGVESVRVDGGWRTRGRLQQTHTGPGYRLRVPVRVAGRSESNTAEIEVDARDTGFAIDTDFQPVRLSVDPGFDVFRRLDRSEVPPSLGAAFGAGRITFVLSGDAGEGERAAQRAFIESWHGSGRSVRTIPDDAPLPQSGAVWLLGWDNRHRPRFQSLLGQYDTGFRNGELLLDGARLSRAEAAVTLAVRSDAGAPLLWTHTADADAGAMARRLTHYSRQSFVAFRGGRPLKRGQWPVLDSALTVELD